MKRKGHGMRGWIYLERYADGALVKWQCAGCGCLVTAFSDADVSTCWWPRKRNCPNARAR